MVNLPLKSFDFGTGQRDTRSVRTLAGDRDGRHSARAIKRPREMGRSLVVLLTTYAHVSDEYEDAPSIEEAAEIASVAKFVPRMVPADAVASSFWCGPRNTKGPH